MKLKGLGNRAYNVLFHTHTVTGIVISFALFVIFYAGAFALFRHEIVPWENVEARRAADPGMDIERALNKVDSIYRLDWHATTNVLFPDENSPFLKVYGAFHDTDTTVQRMAAYVAPGTYRVQDMQEPMTTVGDTIYYLHYFRQIPVIGLYLSGFVALFFLFASITGVLIHWRNLFTKFYAFITEGKWKTIWTNAHTVLGVIGLPFQVMYAVTGAFFGLLTLILLPSVLLLYDGDSSKVFNKVTPENTIELDHDAPLAQNKSLTELKEKVQRQYPGFHISRAVLRNYGRSDALVTWRIDDEEGILFSGSITMYMADGIVLDEVSVFPLNKPYSQSVIDMITKLHFAEFGGTLVKIIYFILAMITCFMIISGVLIWRTARDNDQYTFKQRLFHHRVTKSYLAICLSMFPAFAIIFIANKLVPMALEDRVSWVNTIFFSSWLLLTLIGLFWNSYARQNKNYLLTGGVLSLGVPLANGFITGDWFWETWYTFPWVAYVDVSWMVAGLISIYTAIWVLKVPKKSDRPIDEHSATVKREGKAARSLPKVKPKLEPQLAMTKKEG